MEEKKEVYMGLLKAGGQTKVRGWGDAVAKGKQIVGGTLFFW